MPDHAPLPQTVAELHALVLEQRKRRGTAVLNCAIEDAKVVPTIFE